MDFLKQTSRIVLTENCADEYFEKFNFFDGDCFKSSLSKCLGLGLILGSLLVKLPQILKIWRSKSGVGVSLVSVSFDLSAILIYASYSYVNGFPFSSWGDAAFLGLQTLIIGALILHYSGKTFHAIVYCSVYSALCFVLVSGLTSLKVLWTLQGCNIPILLIGKLSQAATNYQNGHTGQLSAVTTFMLFAGSSARIFTSIQETGDLMTIVTYLFSTAANGVLVLQMFYYWNVDVKAADKKTKAAEKKKAT